MLPLLFLALWCEMHGVSEAALSSLLLPVIFHYVNIPVGDFIPLMGKAMNSSHTCCLVNVNKYFLNR